MPPIHDLIDTSSWCEWCHLFKIQYIQVACLNCLLLTGISHQIIDVPCCCGLRTRVRTELPNSLIDNCREYTHTTHTQLQVDGVTNLLTWLIHTSLFLLNVLLGQLYGLVLHRSLALSKCCTCYFLLISSCFKHAQHCKEANGWGSDMAACHTLSMLYSQLHGENLMILYISLVEWQILLRGRRITGRTLAARSTPQAVCNHTGDHSTSGPQKLAKQQPEWFKLDHALSMILDAPFQPPPILYFNQVYAAVLLTCTFAAKERFPGRQHACVRSWSSWTWKKASFTVKGEKLNE